MLTPPSSNLFSPPRMPALFQHFVLRSCANEVPILAHDGGHQVRPIPVELLLEQTGVEGESKPRSILVETSRFAPISSFILFLFASEPC